MVLPVTPYALLEESYKFNPLSGICTEMRKRSGQRQAKPFDRPLRYESQRANTSYGYVESPFGSAGEDADNFFFKMGELANKVRSGLMTKSYLRLRDLVYDDASLGVTLVEYNQALNMIMKRGKQLRSAFQAVNRFDFVSAARILRLAIVPKGVSLKKSVANNWLEYWFGWKPMISDVYDACIVLNIPMNLLHKHGTARTFVRDLDSVSGPISVSTDRVLEMKVKQGAEFAIRNPNLHLAEQLGLINPLSLAWEVVNFSFVIDWFVGIGDYLQALTAYAGMEIRNPFHTESLTGYSAYAVTRLENAIPGVPYGSAYTMTKGNWTARDIGIASGELPAVRTIKLPSKTRALTAWSLLTQLMSTKR